MCHEAGLPSSMRLVLDVTPHVCSTGEAIHRCTAFLESHSIDARCVQTFTLLICEAIANAMQHGVLRVPRTAKEDPFNTNGNFYTGSSSGWIAIKIDLQYEEGDSGAINAIAVEVADSGAGFDWRSYLPKATMPSPELLYGRGLALIKASSTNLSFNEDGSTIRFVIPCKVD